MVFRTLVSPLVALLVAVHGVPLAALAPLLGCPQGAEAATVTVKEGDHCERKPVRKEHPCPHHRVGAGTGTRTDRGPAIYSTTCSCGHSAAMTPSASDPLMRPAAVAVSFDEPCREVTGAPLPEAGAPARTPPSPPPRPALV